ncbi:hypothetical protein F52700_6723 [Fusarium sp. NRRL 52700]|nr:hypothetical protein F52700_6723 [Fusarium sp. NRRL 52700]
MPKKPKLTGRERSLPHRYHDLDVGSQAVNPGAQVSISKLSLDCSLGRFQILKVKHQGIQFGSEGLGTPLALGILASYQCTSGVQPTVPLSCVLGFDIAAAYLVGTVQLAIRLLWDWKAGLSGRGTRGFKVHIEETLEEFDSSPFAAINKRLDQHQQDIEENSELITIAGAKIFELEPVIDQIEKEFPIAKKALQAYCKKTLEEFSDDLDDMARLGSDKWSLIDGRGEMSALIDKVSDDDAKLKEQMKKQNSALLRHAIGLQEEKVANAQLKADVASIMHRLAAVEGVVHPAMCEAAEQKLGEMGVSDAH